MVRAPATYTYLANGESGPSGRVESRRWRVERCGRRTREAARASTTILAEPTARLTVFALDP